MTRLQFISICGEYLILPELVLELDNARKAISDNDEKTLRVILETEF